MCTDIKKYDIIYVKMVLVCSLLNTNKKEKVRNKMEYKFNMNSDVDSWKEIMLVYSSALKEIGTKLEILNDEFQHVHRYNPIEHIKSRIKTAESIVKKLKKNVQNVPVRAIIGFLKLLQLKCLQELTKTKC